MNSVAQIPLPTRANRNGQYSQVISFGAHRSRHSGPDRPHAARAADKSPWNEDVRSAVQLSPAQQNGDAVLRAGIEVKLQPGWKTYWRYPGDSGVPPHFDFSASENLKAATVLYPAPYLFKDETGHTIGYKDKVVFPVVVHRSRPGSRSGSALKVDYAVCEKLCVPAEGRAELMLVLRQQRARSGTDAAEAHVPRHVTRGTGRAHSAPQQYAEQNRCHRRSRRARQQNP